VQINTYKITVPSLLTTFIYPNSFKINCGEKFAEVICANNSSTRFRVFIEDELINCYGIEDVVEQLLKYFSVKSIDSDKSFVEILRNGIEGLSL
jgi:Leu/Phe-tRNA-protein transferase